MVSDIGGNNNGNAKHCADRVDDIGNQLESTNTIRKNGSITIVLLS